MSTFLLLSSCFSRMLQRLEQFCQGFVSSLFVFYSWIWTRSSHMFILSLLELTSLIKHRRILYLEGFLEYYHLILCKKHQESWKLRWVVQGHRKGLVSWFSLGESPWCLCWEHCVVLIQLNSPPKLKDTIPAISAFMSVLEKSNAHSKV